MGSPISDGWPERENRRRSSYITVTGGSKFEIRRVEPLETDVLAGQTRSGPSFWVRHRRHVYAIQSHEPVRHAPVDDREAVLAVDVRDGARRITDRQLGRESTSPGMPVSAVPLRPGPPL